MASSIPVKKFLFWFIILFIALLVLTRVLALPVVKWAVNDWFEQQGLQSQFGDMALDLQHGKFNISGFSASAEGKTVIELKRFDLDWDWNGILDKKITVNQIAVDGLDFDVRQKADGGLIVGSLDLDKLASENPAPAPDNSEPAEPLEWTFQLNQFSLNNVDLCYQQENIHDYCTELGELAWNGKVFIDLANIQQQPLPIELAGGLVISTLVVNQQILNRKMLDMGSLEFNQISSESLGLINIDKLLLSQLKLLERANAEPAAQISALEKLEITNIALADFTRLTIDQINLIDHQALIIKNENASMEFAEWIPVTSNSNTATADNPESAANTGTAQSPALLLAIKQINYQTSNALVFEDRSLKIPFSVNLNNTQLIIDNVDTAKPDQPIAMQYSTQYSDHGEITMQGDLKPLAVKPSFDLDGVIKGLDLRDLTAFTGETIGHSVKSGQLNANMDILAEESVLNSKIDLELHHFNLKALSDEDKQELDADFGLPIDTALSLLRDRDNKIELSIPITGDLENPEFNPEDAIQKAVSSAVTTAVLLYYTPLGLLLAADGLIDLATALNFEPVVYPPGVGDIATVNNQSLEKILTLMNERPGIHVTLCAFTNTQDRLNILEETAEIPLEELELNDEQKAALLALGEARAVAIKSYLEEKQIAAERMVICNSEHEEGEGLSGVEISI